MKPDDEYAFPYQLGPDIPGMTLRDYFAAAAMQGMFASDSADGWIKNARKAVLAYQMADLMLAERSK